MDRHCACNGSDTWLHDGAALVLTDTRPDNSIIAQTVFPPLFSQRFSDVLIHTLYSHTALTGNASTAHEPIYCLPWFPTTHVRWNFERLPLVH